MKKLLPLALTTLVVSVVSCQKQPLDAPVQPPSVSEVTLSQDENLRLMLMSERTRSDQELLNSVTSLLPEFATKSLTFSITDSLAFDSNTKNSDPITVYVVSKGDNTGFALTVKELTLPVIVGYFDGEFDKDNMNPGFAIMLENTVDQLTYLRDSINQLRNDDVYHKTATKLGFIAAKGPLPGEEAPTIPEWDRYERFIDREWADITLSVDPLLKTNWGQGHPYNSEIHRNPAVGCTATSAAQIMAYYKFPANSPLDGQPYNWTSLPKSAQFYWNNIATNSVGRLFWDLCSDRCLNMIHLFDHWFNTGSFPGSLNCTNTSRTFEIFGYYGGSHRSYNTSAIATELSKNRPVHICGKAHQLSGWHTWVLDGWLEYRQMQEGHIDYYRYNQKVYTMQITPTILYEGGRSHHNFGWDGSENGWFGMTSTSAGFPIDMEIITGIQPKN